ncbi:hypothetical protein O3M35_003215 [Rhynocoris fuscipes]|uniref:Uncharacterized protein n=1 Tax=Rhynocoris fuscipes TaxID=488301 RepID=A0AAW1CQU4_9HEMI
MLEQSYIQNFNILRPIVFELCRIRTSAHPQTHTDAQTHRRHVVIMQNGFREA